MNFVPGDLLIDTDNDDLCFVIAMDTREVYVIELFTKDKLSMIMWRSRNYIEKFYDLY